MTDAAEPKPLTPAARARGAVTGSPIPIEGQTWLLAQAVPVLGGVWDRLYDRNVIFRTYDDRTDIRLAALALLEANYELTTDEAVGLIREAAIARLVPAVELALFGIPDPHITYSEWAAYSLWANGIDPARVPADVRHYLLNYLVAAGRAIPADRYVTSRIAVRQSKKFQGMAKASMERQAQAAAEAAKTAADAEAAKALAYS